MIKFITRDKRNKYVVIKNDVNLKEEIKMSLISMAMNIGSFNVKISVNRNEQVKKNIERRRSEHDQRINEALERRNNLIYDYNMYDYMMMI